MFPEKSGGLALYAHEAWRKYTTLVGPIATFGYWIGWSVVLSFHGLFIGSLIQGTWFPGEPGGSYLAADGYFSTGGAEVGLPAADRDRADPLRLAVQRLRGTRRRHVRLRAPASC